MLFLVLATSQLGVALGVRARRGIGLALGTAVSAAAALGVGAVYLPPLRTLLDTQAVTAPQLALVAGCSLAAYVVARWTSQARGGMQ